MIFQLINKIKKSIFQDKSFSEKFYIDYYPDVRKAVQSEEFNSGWQHYLVHGKKEGRFTNQSQLLLHKSKNAKLYQEYFDPNFYAKTYPEVNKWCQENKTTSFEHYLVQGIEKQYSPSQNFCEKWYRLYYSDVEDAIIRGELESAFEHYLKSGKKEGRYACLDTRKNLERLYPGVTQAVGIVRVADIEHKISIPNVEFSPIKNQRINFLVPTLDPDVFFGGYAALIKLAERFYQEGVEVRFLVCEDFGFSKNWCLQKLDAVGVGFIKDCEVINITDRKNRIDVRKSDRFLAYNSWLLYVASGLSEYTANPKPLYLAQEDERIFHCSDSLRVIINSAYAIPHIPIVNSSALLEHFKQERLGIFSDQTLAIGKDYFCFEHVLTQVEKPTREELTCREKKKFLMYARPEGHAQRNLFEVAILSIKKAIHAGMLGDEWEFTGIGSLTDGLTIKLTERTSMKILPRLPESNYAKELKKYDLGLSLMAAPHPGLIHFEMASAGIPVVTNLYGNRDEIYFKEKSELIVPAPLGVGEIAAALATAAKLSGDIEKRTRAKVIHFNKSWNDAFSQNFIKKIKKAIW